jgi:hypothetical protein
VEDIRPQECLIELVRYTHRINVLHAVKGLANFLRCSRLANQIPIRRLRSPRALAGLAELVRVVEENLDSRGEAGKQVGEDGPGRNLRAGDQHRPGFVPGVRD